MKMHLGILLLTILLGLASACSSSTMSTLTLPVSPTLTQQSSPLPTLKLPEPKLEGTVSLEEALFKRRSVREYANLPLALEDISQLLWAAYGITAEWGGRTAPSAGGLYPLEIYLAAGNVENLASGVYKYKPQGHELTKVKDGDVRTELSEAALGQTWVKEGAIDIVIAAVYERTTQKYGDRGVRYVQMEVGHAAQNIYLQATALNLNMVTVGAFDDDRVKGVMGMLEEEAPLYVIPVGRKAS